MYGQTNHEFAPFIDEHDTMPCSATVHGHADEDGSSRKQAVSAAAFGTAMQHQVSFCTLNWRWGRDKVA